VQCTPACCFLPPSLPASCSVPETYHLCCTPVCLSAQPSIHRSIHPSNPSSPASTPREDLKTCKWTLSRPSARIARIAAGNYGTEQDRPRLWSAGAPLWPSRGTSPSLRSPLANTCKSLRVFIRAELIPRSPHTPVQFSPHLAIFRVVPDTRLPLRRRRTARVLHLGR